MTGAIPLVVFNLRFLFIEPVLTQVRLPDAAGNPGIVVIGLWGGRSARREETA
ncbi:hypothetical protein [Rhodophyticola sp.]|uniref:hypothetical protein n=1 Tax=Rhodophyticola sp. TaxID=2680032 RepID=UPI003D2E5DCC